MGEYIKYKNQEIKLGTCESLYYATLPKYLAAYNAGHLRSVVHNLSPSGYLNVEQGFLFRFPFPDEDHLPLGEFLHGFNRSLPIEVSPSVFSAIMGSEHQGSGYSLAIEFQKPVYRIADKQLCNALVFRDSVGMQLYRLEDDYEVKLLIGELVKNHISKEVDVEKRKFFRQIGARILKGYRLQTPALNLSSKVEVKVPGVDTQSSESSRTADLTMPNVDKKRKQRTRKRW